MDITTTNKPIYLTLTFKYLILHYVILDSEYDTNYIEINHLRRFHIKHRVCEMKKKFQQST
jgi:hypothetical protein